MSEDDFGYYLRASVDIVVVSAIYLPRWPSRRIASGTTPSASSATTRKRTGLSRPPASRSCACARWAAFTERHPRAAAEHLNEMIRTVRADMLGCDQAIKLLRDLPGASNQGQSACIEAPTGGAPQLLDQGLRERLPATDHRPNRHSNPRPGGTDRWSMTQII